MHDRRVPRQPGREQTVVVEVDDAIDREPARGGVDDVDAEQVSGPASEPRRYLPPPVHRPDHTEKEQPREPESKFARRAKLIALFVAMALLLASLYIAASLSESGERDGAESPRSPAITGAAALGGFALPAGRAVTEMETRREPSVQAAGPKDPAAETTTAEGSLAVGSAPNPGQVDTEKSATTGTDTQADELDAVRDFYQLAASEPAEALRLLGPALAGKHDDHLLRAWRSMRSIRLDDVRHGADGTVRAVVTMVPADGTPLRLTQLLRFTHGPRLLINEATLVSVKAE
ncbi:hypothetical protein FHU38_004480 [Saccharomonospora amisosensis]|uniref:Uncharacterized protein n=1 Tax=Saccharomonospora amisosensis TaxID=1128677 RepID=A0A7X5UTT9_9PSEU|nr:hypothetical protein [Saccharomonospora amisosensis]NIJ14136.1 hypothetical protein [Saccharomonospora amisosensis]